MPGTQERERVADGFGLCHASLPELAEAAMALNTKGSRNPGASWCPTLDQWGTQSAVGLAGPLGRGRSE